MITPELSARVDARLADLLCMLPPDFPAPRVTYYSARLAAGRAVYASNTIELNAVLLAQNVDSMLSDTVAHELAHLAVHRTWINKGRQYPRPKPHGREWQWLMRHVFGVKPERTHNYDVSCIPARVSRIYDYRCGCMTHKVTAVRHGRVKRGTNYRCKLCKQRIVEVV